MNPPGNLVREYYVLSLILINIIQSMLFCSVKIIVFSLNSKALLLSFTWILVGRITCILKFINATTIGWWNTDPDGTDINLRGNGGWNQRILWSHARRNLMSSSKKIELFSLTVCTHNSWGGWLPGGYLMLRSIVCTMYTAVC